MSPQANVNERKAGTAQLHAALEPLLSRHFGARRILRLERRASEYSSSFALDELDVSLDDGTSLSLIFKDLGWQALTDSARGVKPDCLYNPLREIETYQTVLARSRLGTATCYGAVVDPPQHARDRQTGRHCAVHEHNRPACCAPLCRAPSR